MTELSFVVSERTLECLFMSFGIDILSLPQ